MNVTIRTEVDAVERLIRTEAGRLDALVQFAGMGLRGFFEDLALDEIQRVYDVNVFGTMTVTQVMLPLIKASRGRVVMTTSIAGRIGSMSISGYASSKFARRRVRRVPGAGDGAIRRGRVAPRAGARVDGSLHAQPEPRQARDGPAGPYYRWFCQHEQIVDDLLRRNRFTPRDVAAVVETILRARRPRLRYVVGAKARLVVSLRRHLPGEFFERVYWGLVRRMVTAPKHQAAGLSAAGEVVSEQR